MADVGQEEDFEAAKAKALKVGAEKCYVADLKKEFIEELCWPAVQCNAIYENVYLLGESFVPSFWYPLFRPLIMQIRNLARSSCHCPCPDRGCS